MITLLSIIRKWLRATNKRTWSITDQQPYPGSKGVLQTWTMNNMGKVIVIYDDHAIYDNITLKAVDPKFLTKLDRLMQFIERAPKRYERYMSEFNKKERELLHEMLKL